MNACIVVLNDNALSHNNQKRSNISNQRNSCWNKVEEEADKGAFWLAVYLTDQKVWDCIIWTIVSDSLLIWTVISDWFAPGDSDRFNVSQWEAGAVPGRREARDKMRTLDKARHASHHLLCLWAYGQLRSKHFYWKWFAYGQVINGSSIIRLFHRYHTCKWSK